MSHFLQRLAERARGGVPTVAPRRPSRFEPVLDGAPEGDLVAGGMPSSEGKKGGRPGAGVDTGIFPGDGREDLGRPRPPAVNGALDAPAVSERAPAAAADRVTGPTRRGGLPVTPGEPGVSDAPPERAAAPVGGTAHGGSGVRRRRPGGPPASQPAAPDGAGAGPPPGASAAHRGRGRSPLGPVSSPAPEGARGAEGSGPPVAEAPMPPLAGEAPPAVPERRPLRPPAPSSEAPSTALRPRAPGPSPEGLTAPDASGRGVSRFGPAAAAEPTVRVTIGSIEVRAVQPRVQAPPRAPRQSEKGGARTGPGTTLEEYLRRRREGAR